MARLVCTEMPATEHREGFPESMSPSLPEQLCPLRSVWGINLWGPPPRLQLSVSLPVPFQATCKANPKKEAQSPSCPQLGASYSPSCCFLSTQLHKQEVPIPGRARLCLVSPRKGRSCRDAFLCDGVGAGGTPLGTNADTGTTHSRDCEQPLCPTA